MPLVKVKAVRGVFAAGIDCEPAHRRRAVTVEDQRLRRAREVDACERIDLRDRQTLSHGVVAGPIQVRRRCWPKIQ